MNVNSKHKEDQLNELDIKHTVAKASEKIKDIFSKKQPAQAPDKTKKEPAQTPPDIAARTKGTPPGEPIPAGMDGRQLLQHAYVQARYETPQNIPNTKVFSDVQRSWDLSIGDFVEVDRAMIKIKEIFPTKKSFDTFINLLNKSKNKNVTSLESTLENSKLLSKEGVDQVMNAISDLSTIYFEDMMGNRFSIPLIPTMSYGDLVVALQDRVDPTKWFRFGEEKSKRGTVGKILRELEGKIDCTTHELAEQMKNARETRGLMGSKRISLQKWLAEYDPETTKGHPIEQVKCVDKAFRSQVVRILGKLAEWGGAKTATQLYQLLTPTQERLRKLIGLILTEELRNPRR